MRFADAWPQPHTAAVERKTAKMTPPPPATWVPDTELVRQLYRVSGRVCVPYKIVVCRSPERAAASAASWRRSGVLSPSTRRETLSSWLFMRCSRRRLLLAMFRWALFRAGRLGDDPSRSWRSCYRLGAHVGLTTIPARPQRGETALVASPLPLTNSAQLQSNRHGATRYIGVLLHLESCGVNTADFRAADGSYSSTRLPDVPTPTRNHLF